MTKKEVFFAPDLPPRMFGAHAVKAGDLIFTSGNVAFDPRSGLVDEVRELPGHHVPQVAGRHQAEYVLTNAEKSLNAAGSSLALGVRIDQYVTAPPAASPYLEARTARIGLETRPASSHLMASDLFVPGALHEIQLIAIAKDGGLEKKMIVAPDVPASPGPPFKPAPHAVAAGDYIFVTGQVSADFPRGMAPEAIRDPRVWYGSSIKLQTDYTLNRCKSILTHAGSSLDKVVRADVYLTDMDDAYEMDAIWRKHFPKDPPALCFVPVPRLAPVDCIIEITLIALSGDSKLTKETIMAPSVPVSPFHAPHAIKAGDFLYISSLPATDWKGHVAPEATVPPGSPWFYSSAKRQMACILDRMAAVCKAGGTSLGDLVWMQSLFAVPEDLCPSLEVLNETFGSTPPTALVLGIPKPVFGGCTIMLDGVAVV